MRCVGSGGEDKALEIGMLESLLRGDSLLWVKDHHLHHQVNCLLTRIWNQLVQRGWDKLGELEIQLGCKLVPLWPFCLGWTSQNGTGLIYLICLVVTGE